MSDPYGAYPLGLTLVPLLDSKNGWMQMARWGAANANPFSSSTGDKNDGSTKMAGDRGGRQYADADGRRYADSESQNGVQVAGDDAAAKEALALQREVDTALSDVYRDIRAANDRNGILYDPSRANKELGSIVRADGGDFTHTPPSPYPPQGLEFQPDGFIGGPRLIENASALAIGTPPFRTPSYVLGEDARFSALSGQVGAPVYVITTRGAPSVFRFTAHADPVQIR